MDTAVSITVLHRNKKTAQEALDRAFSTIESLALKFNNYDKNSEISRVNRNARDNWVELSPEMYVVIKRSLLFSGKTEGAFDITVRPLILLWKTAARNNSMPDDRTVRETLERTGYRKIIFRDNRLKFTRDDISIDLGGVAKGYIVDEAVRTLKSLNVENALVDAGGNIYAVGRNQYGKPWNIGIRHPRKPGKIADILHASNRAIVTSGDYERFFTIKGKRFHHILDPRTGYPAGLCMSVTIIASNSCEADILSTSIFVLGPEKGIELLDKLPGIEGIVMDKNGKIFYTRNIGYYRQIVR